mgnify:CR=1 FL=1
MPVPVKSTVDVAPSCSDSSARGAAQAVAIDHAPLVRQLLELVAALDRRMPQVMRAGETAIARDAAALRQRALRRIEELCGGSE